MVVGKIFLPFKAPNYFGFFWRNLLGDKVAVRSRFKWLHKTQLTFHEFPFYNFGYLLLPFPYFFTFLVTNIYMYFNIINFNLFSFLVSL